MMRKIVNNSSVTAKQSLEIDLGSGDFKVQEAVSKILAGDSVRDVLISEAMGGNKYLSTDAIKTSLAVSNFFADSSLVKDFYNFMTKWNKASEDYYKQHFGNVEYEPLMFSIGKNYIKVVRRGAIDAFVDKFGNVYKPAGWNAPAKGVRYYLSDYNNIHFDPHGSFLYGNRKLIPNTADSFKSENDLKESLGMFGEDDSFFIECCHKVSDANEKESKSIFESVSDIKEAFAAYTGGGIWLFYGKLKDGTWFLTDDYGSTLILDADPSDLDESTYPEWQDEHKIKELSGAELKNFDDDLLDKLLSYPSNDYKHTGGISNSEIDAYRKYFKSV